MRWPVLAWVLEVWGPRTTEEGRIRILLETPSAPPPCYPALPSLLPPSSFWGGLALCKCRLWFPDSMMRSRRVALSHRSWVRRKTKIITYSYPVLRIRDDYPGFRMRIFSIPDQNFFILGSRIVIKPKNFFLSSRKYIPGCSSRIRILIFYPSRISDPGSRDQKGTETGSATLFISIQLLLCFIMGASFGEKSFLTTDNPPLPNPYAANSALCYFNNFQCANASPGTSL